MNEHNASRRDFIKTTGFAGGGLIFGFSLTGCGGNAPLPIEPISGALVPNAFVQITPANVIRFFCPRDEMGQGVTTGLATLLAEELDVAPASLDIQLAGPHPDYTNPDFGLQATGGSSSLKAHYYPMRQAGANVRAVLIEAAAFDLGVEAGAITTDNAHVVVDGERHPYGRFTTTASRLLAPAQAPLKDKRDFKYIGKEFPRLDAMAKSTGTAVYGIDVDIPNMHHAVVKRCPVAGGSVRSYDKSSVVAAPGVTDVVEVATGVAVVAEKFWQAHKAAELLTVEWDLPELAEVSSATVLADYQAAMVEEEGSVAGERGDLQRAFADADIVVESEYWAPYLAHAPLEPMNAVVRIENGEADLWSGTQGPGIAQGIVARFAGLDKDKVRVHSTYLGGAFGRRGTLSHITEAIQVAVATGKPIQLLWTREDDIRSGVYRPASLMKIKAGVDRDGIVTGWQAKRVGGNITPGVLTAALPGALPTAVPNGMIDWMVGTSDSIFDDWMVDHASIEGLYEDYDLPNREVHHVTKNHGLPLTFWRSVGHSFTAFAKESLVDELAAKANRDVVEFRLRNTRNNPRLNNVIEVAGAAMKRLQSIDGRSLGFAAHASFGSYVAQVAQVSVEGGEIKVHHVVCVVDCGQVVNPDIVRAQMEGSIMFGLTAALHGNLDLDKGAIRQSNFHDYPILRMNEAPSVEVIIVESDEDPTGVGEPGLPPIAPAVANAVYAASGQRLRRLPLVLA